ncbi:pyridine nucleotide-disulfide oxidoreductase-domain-containing protein [Cladorrhinum sp. PSN259]|nr:pyridine nucleotide-disulfide oxidoreductase-domain-containing protein [Cladorrhinum sp. PSN259]
MPPVTSALRRQHVCKIYADASILIRAATRQYQKSPSIRFVRLNHHDSAPKSEGPVKAAAIVVGAGPAGIATVGNLLETIKDGKVIWIDREFNGGRINRAYREVPGNTAVKLFVDYAKAVEPFRDIYDSAEKPNAITALEELPQDGTCSLSYAGNMLNFLTKELLNHPRLISQKGNARGAKRGTDVWTVTTGPVKRSHEAVQQSSAPLLIFCTGSHPTEVEVPPQPQELQPLHRCERLPLDTALTPSTLSNIARFELQYKIRKYGEKGGHLKIAVIGGSHSAILVLMNLCDIAKQYPLGTVSINWLCRSETLKYAEQREGYILNDNTGLKGQAAKFARENLDGDALHNSSAGVFIHRHLLKGNEAEQLKSGLSECDFYVQAIGYERDALPQTSVGRKYLTDEEGGLISTLEIDPRTGAIGKQADGLYGAGIAFPEEVDTPEGKKEMAVGMWKFMTYLKRVVPEWVKETGADKK